MKTLWQLGVLLVTSLFLSLSAGFLAGACVGAYRVGLRVWGMP